MFNLKVLRSTSQTRRDTLELQKDLRSKRFSPSPIKRPPHCRNNPVQKPKLTNRAGI